MEKKKTRNIGSLANKEENELTILRLKQQVAACTWIQALAILSEAWAVTRLFYLEDQQPGSQEIVHGLWMQAIGQLTEAIGVSNQLLAQNNAELFSAQRTSINGDWLQSLGAGLEATGGEMVLRDSLLADGDGFVP